MDGDNPRRPQVTPPSVKLGIPLSPTPKRDSNSGHKATALAVRSEVRRRSNRCKKRSLQNLQQTASAVENPIFGLQSLHGFLRDSEEKSREIGHVFLCKRLLGIGEGVRAYGLPDFFSEWQRNAEEELKKNAESKYHILVGKIYRNLDEP